MTDHEITEIVVGLTPWEVELLNDLMGRFDKSEAFIMTQALRIYHAVALNREIIQRDLGSGFGSLGSTEND